MLQEGQTFNGLGYQRGSSFIKIFKEIAHQGGGLKKYYTSYDGFALRTFAYTTARVSAFLYFYDWINRDPRRAAKPEKLFYAAVPAGVIAGIVTNPLEIAFTRMQVEDMYPKAYRRGYTSFGDAITQIAKEGALFRGAVTNGVRIAVLLGTITGMHDWMKENTYYFLGPSIVSMALPTLMATAIASTLSIPFDNIRIRLYTQRALPNGILPYGSGLNALAKVAVYESSSKHSANFNSLFAGF